MIRSGGDVARLLGELGDADAVRCDAAVARLRIIGPGAVGSLTDLALGEHAAGARLAALKALEGIDDPRTIDPAAQLTADRDPAIASAAIAVLRQWVTREQGTRVLDVLTRTALDASLDAGVRLAALDAVAELPRHLVAPLLEQASLARSRPAIGDDPTAALDWLSRTGAAPLSRIHNVVVQLREREGQERTDTRREQWTRARAAAHAVLAARRSSVALYDLRETFDSATRPLPVDYLTAVAAIGDASCLEPMARAWSASPVEDWWRTRLVEAAGDIMQREKLNGRSAVVKRIRARWRGFL